VSATTFQGTVQVHPGIGRWPVVWTLALAASLALYLARDMLSAFVVYPDALRIPVADWIGAGFLVIKTNFTWLTRSLTAILDVPLRFAFELLARGFTFEPAGAAPWSIPRLSWVGLCAVAGITGWSLGGRSLGLLALIGSLYIALFGQWESAMTTLALIAICVPLCAAVGLLFGIWAFRNPSLDRLLISPALDLMQTVPTFAYLVPMLLLFGNNPVSALLATAIFATPPMVRATTLGLARVPPDIQDFADMVGCTRSQQLWRVLLPAALPMLLLGLNQVTMLTLNMVIISSMIGAGGLGYDVLLALRALKIGDAMEAGLAIVALAIVLDRLGQGAALVRAPAHTEGLNLWRRHANLWLALAVLAATTLASLWLPGLAKVPAGLTLTTAPYWKMAVDWVTVHWFDTIESIRVALIVYGLNPIRAFCVAIPWLAGVGLLGLAGLQLGGWRLGALVAVLATFCAVTGLWEKTMATVYLCGVASLLSAAIGIPIGLAAARSDRIERFVMPLIDTLQTIPSFCFIIPVVMLFRVGDVTALIATVAFAVVPAVRYTNHGIRQVPAAMIDAATTSGCTPLQTFWRVQLPLALPEILLGLSQTILMALSMIIICAMIGTRDLGQEVFISLAKADAGRGIVAGLAIAFIGIIADRLLSAGTARMRRNLGLS